MKVLLVNGSPKKNGCTYTALCEIAKELEKQGIESEIFHIGTDACVYSRRPHLPYAHDEREAGAGGARSHARR